MDVKKQLLKIEESKKDIQRKDLVKSLCEYLSKPKNQKINDQLSKHDYNKTIKKLYNIKEYDLFLQLLTSIIQNIPDISDKFRSQYQETILNLIIPKRENKYEAINNNFNYFLIATKDLNDISNIKHKEYLIYYMFFNVLIKLKLEPKILDLFLKLQKYMSNYQYELILYVLTIYSFVNKAENPDDFSQQMLIVPKIIEFCKINFLNEEMYLKNYDIIKYIFLMLLLYSPFKHEILMDFYDKDPILFINLMQDIINYIDNKFRDLYINDQEDNNSFFNKYCDKNNSYLININHFFSDDLDESDFDDFCSNKNKLYNYFNNKQPLIKEYKNFINKIHLNEIQEKNKNDIFKGIIWTISSLILKNYYISDTSTEKKDIKVIDNKTHCLSLFNSLINLFQLINNNNQKMFLKQYLELIKSLLNQTKIFEDWNYILNIINLCLDIIIKKDITKEIIEKQFKNEINLLNEIFIIILNIYNKNELVYCDIEQLSLIFHKFNQFLQKEILLCFYINIYLINEHKNKKKVIELDFKNNNIYVNFINNIETLVYNMLYSSSKINITAKNYLMEIIRINYIYDHVLNEEDENKNILRDKKNNIISKQIIIERVLEKYFEKFFISFQDNEINYAFFNYVLTEILSKSHNLEFVKKIITTLIFNNNENINNTLYDEFIEQILGNLLENTINYSSKYVLSNEKLDFIINFFYDVNNMNDKSIIKIALKLIKNFVVNSQYEVLFINSNYYNSYLMNNINYHHKHSMIVIDYNYNKIQKFKKKFQNREGDYDYYHKNYYAPFTLFEHIDLFSALNYHLTNNIKKTLIFENILEFYYLCLNRNLYILKGVNFKDFLNLIIKEKDITKISSSKKSTFYLLKILSCLPYQLHNEISFNSSNHILKIKNLSYGEDLQLLIDPKYKFLSINCLINLWNLLNSSINNSLNKIFSNEQLTQTIFNNNNNKNINEKMIKNVIDNMMKTGELYLWCGELNLYTQFEYTYNCIKILKLYLISCINDILYVKKNSINYYNYNDKNLKESINSLFNNNPNAFTSIKNIVVKIYTQIFNSLNYKYFNKKYVYFILSLLFDIKELITLFILKEEKKDSINNYKKSFSNNDLNNKNNILNLTEGKKNEGINMILKTIFISMFLSWNNEDKIIEKFDKYLNTNYKMNILSKEKFIILNKYYKEKTNYDEGIQNLIDNISDYLNLYLMEYIPQNDISILINIINEIFPNPSRYREYFFYKMSEWTMKIKKNRDALNIDYKNIYDIKYLNNISSYGEDTYIGQKILKNAQVFYGNNSLIIINPITITKCCFTFRNPISHMNLIFDSNIPIINNTNIKEEIEKELEEDEEEEDKQDDNLNENISNSFSSDSNEFNQNDDEIIPEFLKKRKLNNIKSSKNLDDESFKRFNSLENEDSSGDIFTLQRKNSEKIQNYEFNDIRSKENEDKSKNKNNYLFKRQRFNSDFGDKYKQSIIFSEQKKRMMENGLKLFSIMAELTDYKVEKYKWIDISKDNNLYNITKLTQYLDLLPVYFCYNCGLIYYSETKNDVNSLASYMYFIEKLGSLFDYYDFYPDKNKKDLSSKIINKNNQKDKYIIINQDSFVRINFHVINLTQIDKNKLIGENNIIFIWIDNSNNSYDYNTNICNDKVKVFFIISQITENLYKIQRKYNQIGKAFIVQVIEELFINDFIIDIESQSSIQLLLNMIMSIDILIKIQNINKNKLNYMKTQNESNKKNENIIDNDKNTVKKTLLDNQNKVISNHNISPSGCNNNFEEIFLNENDIMDENISSIRKRYELINKLCQE